MLIYILHSDRIYTFRLPKEISGSYILNDYDSENRFRSLTSIRAVDNKWYISSNEEAYVVFNGQKYDEIQLVEYSFYTITLYNNENVYLYIYPGDEKNVFIKEIMPGTTFDIGSSGSCEVAYLNKSVGAKQIELTYNNGIWNYKNLNSSIPVYINKRNISEGTLSSFDSIFVMGLKVILIGNKVMFICHPQMLNFASKKLITEQRNLNVGNINVEENVKDFYDSKDYFSKSPVFFKKYDEYEIVITPPEAKQKGDSSSALFQLVPTAMMSVTSLVSAFFSISGYRSGKTDKESYITSIIMCGVMLFTGIAWPIVEMFASKARTVLFNRLRSFNYNNYLKRKRKELDEVISSEKATLEFNNLSLIACRDAIEKKYSYLFSRNIDSKTFLTIRFGIGKILSSIVFNYSKPDLIVENDKLLKKIDKLMEDYKFIEDSPFTLSLKEVKSLALLNPEGKYDSYLKALLLQLITLHDYKNLKLVIFTNEQSFLTKVRNLNHCWSDDRSVRYFASNINDAENVSSELVRIFNKNLQENNNNNSKNKTNIDTHYLIITDSIEQYKNLKIIENILHSDNCEGFSVIMFGSKIVNVPMGCEGFINYDQNEASYFMAEMDAKNIIKFKPEFITSDIDFDSCLELISNIPIKIESKESGNLPDKLGFLEMYNVGKLEQLNIINKWKTSPVVSSLSAPIGVDASGNLLYLDLHEKKHGPHGLIAGMTGSGKSEFIVTYILSLAISYSPDEVQFVLIDYKGGGLVGAFENRKTGVKLPHLVGTITNLDTAEMNRTLVSIKSELQRRQRKFNEVKEKLNTGSIDIYKYQNLVREGTLDEPMSHLFIICDEFAELKSQQPDFMDELVSAARIGRSLGIHLILATQKPSGVVDEQIWSNSKFKVCCKVQTAEDSNEMIRRADAAYIKESGRFYLQVGYDEYFVKGQSAYSGVQYVPSEKVVSKLDESIAFLNSLGDVYKSVSKKITTENTEKKYGEELNNILKYIVDEANAINYKYNQLWLDNVPKLLYYKRVIEKYKVEIKKFDLNPIIGEYDDPQNQSQGVVTLPITFGGNTFILGASGMGKNTFFTTLIYSTIINHSPDEVNIYILDFGSEKMKKFSKAPQVGDVLSVNDKAKIGYFFHMIKSEIEKRRKYYAENGSDFLLDVKNGNSIFPNILVMIYGMDAFKEMYEEVHDEYFSSIIRNCSKFGVNFVIAGSSGSSINYTVENNFPQKMLLNLIDQSDYQMYFSKAVPPSKNPGRGLVEINGVCKEFQTAMVFDEDDEKNNLDYVIEKLNEAFKNKARPIPFVPKKLSYNQLSENITTIKTVPIGINIVTAQMGYYDFSSKVSVMLAGKMEMVNKFISNFLKTLSLCQENNVIVLNAFEKININVDEKIKVYNSNFKKIVPVIMKNIEKFNQKNTSKYFTVVVLGYSKLNSHLTKIKEEEEDIYNIDDLILNTNNDSFKYILFDSNNGFNSIANGELSNLIDSQNGIWVGNDLDSQESFEYENTYYMNNVAMGNDTVVLIKDSNTEYLKFPTI